MSSLSSWQQRPPEIANLFNPAFIAALIYEFVKEYEKSNSEGAPYPYIPIVITLALHPTTRRKLPSSTVSALYEWVQNNNECLVGLHERSKNFHPYAQEALRFAMLHNAVKFDEGYFLKTDDKKASFTPSFIRESTQEVADIVKTTKFLARWFVKSGSTSSVMSCWGVMP